MGPSRASPQGRLRYIWGDVFLTALGVLGTLVALGKANQVAEQGGSVVPFWVAYAAGAAVAVYWWSMTFAISRQGDAVAQVAGPAVPPSPWPRRGW
jgi:hypothetical protein